MRRRQRQVRLAPSLNGSTEVWRAAWLACLDSIAREFGDAIADNWFQPAILERGDGGRAVVRFDKQVGAERARRDWGDYLARAWAARVPGGDIVILGPRDKEQP